MLLVYFKRHRSMILASVFFFYLGCGITLSFLRIDCADAILEIAPRADGLSSLANTQYAVLVLSSPSNEVRRDAIRATWMKFASNIFVENGERLYKWNHSWTNPSVQQDFIKCYFAIGTQGLSEYKLSQLIAENSRSNDLLLLHNLEDTYQNLTEKMVLALSWLVDNLAGLKYLVKCDDDSFVRIDLIVRDIEAFAPSMKAPGTNEYISYKEPYPPIKGLYWGYFYGRGPVHFSGKWQETGWFMCDKYLPYAFGGGYVVSKSIMDYVAKNAEFLSRYNSEDVSMGVWTAALSHINRVHDTRFDTAWKSRGCHKHMLVRHKQSPADMFQMYRTLVHSQGDILCSTETVVIKPYVYKWDKLPSQCCKV